jgi:hypothetical protein
VHVPNPVAIVLPGIYIAGNDNGRDDKEVGGKKLG